MNRNIRDIQFSILDALCSETSSQALISTNLRSLGTRDEDLDFAWKDLEDRGKVAKESILIWRQISVLSCVSNAKRYSIG
jgi:hypothetical protein